MDSQIEFQVIDISFEPTGWRLDGRVRWGSVGPGDHFATVRVPGTVAGAANIDLCIVKIDRGGKAPDRAREGEWARLDVTGLGADALVPGALLLGIAPAA